MIRARGDFVVVTAAQASSDFLDVRKSPTQLCPDQVVIRAPVVYGGAPCRPAWLGIHGTGRSPRSPRPAAKAPGKGRMQKPRGWSKKGHIHRRAPHGAHLSTPVQLASPSRYLDFNG